MFQSASKLSLLKHIDNPLFQSIIHPDTGDKIPMPFRMSGYVPFGTPIVSTCITVSDLSYNETVSIP